ncbi:kinase-like protein [Nemania abortiva]|nr:kinase-like protein [Nemania abortiva]
MMSYNNVFAILTPSVPGNRAASAFRLQYNSQWFYEAGEGVAEKPIISSRETTPADDFLSDVVGQRGNDCLVLTFDKLLNLEDIRDGIQFGTKPGSSHILLGYRGTRGASARQCNIVVDDDLRIWLKDYHSSHGTAVSYDGQNEREIRKKETWILAYPPGEGGPFGSTVVHSGKLGFRVEFPNHVAANPRYVESLREFVKKCRQNETQHPSVRGLELNEGLTTQAPTNAPTPGAGALYYMAERLGIGSYSQVRRVIRLRDGRVLAAKTFYPPLGGGSRGSNDSNLTWLTSIRREFALLRDNPHPNVVEVFDLQELPIPMIVMPYFPFGNMVDAGIYDNDQHVSAFGQLLDGLVHLHSRNVVHRDLKPENILVEITPRFRVVIADFGLAKAIPDTNPVLRTFCGSAKYAAPEVFPGLGHGHGAKVDIWSLGVIVFEWIYDIPNSPNDKQLMRGTRCEPGELALSGWARTWATLLRSAVEDQEDDLVISVLSHMIEYRAEDRWGADECLAHGFQNGLFKRRGTDNLVACATEYEGDGSDLFAEENNGIKTPTVTDLPARAPPTPSAAIHSETTFMPENP